ncbi:MAG: pyruvate, phosphate dikinase [Candidatus Zixiibacteriota bacterium]
MAEKHVYFFGGGKAEGDRSMKELLGGKGANLAEMTKIGISVPPGFTIATTVCDYYSKNKDYPDSLMPEIKKNLKKTEEIMGKKFEDPKDPLLVSVRSGAAVSMPGMMDTVLNLGLNDKSVEAISKKAGSERFAWDIYRRLINMFGDVVMDIEHEKFGSAMDKMKADLGIKNDLDLTADHLKELVEKYKAIYKEETGEDFPQEPMVQLEKAIHAVFESWDNPRAIKYRKINEIQGLLGTAVNVQTMVYGNMGDDCATGVAFTRNPATGENKFYGEFLFNAQGEDVVAGIRTPKPVKEMGDIMPEIYEELVSTKDVLEKHYRDMQDIEFTIQEGKLWLLQTRTGKRTTIAALKIAVDMVHEGLIDKETAIMRLKPKQLDHLLHPQFDPDADKIIIAKGLPASPGAATGQVVFDAETAEQWNSEGKKVLLVRMETSPEDIGGMDAAEGVLTARGGMTSHAAVVARGMGKTCVAGCDELDVDYENKIIKVDGRKIEEGDFISIDGTSGEVMLGKVDTKKPDISGDFSEFMDWVDEIKRLGVRTNADNPKDAGVARDFGAKGIGLCRTEHMFFEKDRIWVVRRMILAESEEKRREALKELLPYQREDFYGIFKAMDGLPVTVRFLDPPLHEFLPKDKASQKEMAAKLDIDIDRLKTLIEKLDEVNPMLGHRGCRLGITYPEITEMQSRAIFEAACESTFAGHKVFPEIMIPLIGTEAELKNQREIVDRVAQEVFAEKETEVEYKVGTMIEIPRAALTANMIARTAEFFSFGTNDLTQMTFGYSRDDAGVFIPEYKEKGILDNDPFQVLDQEGVGQLVKMGLERGRQTNPKLKVGICGEHGGEPSSVKFCHGIGMDYVSCSPYRVPIARLAAAQAVIEEKK